MAVTYVAQTVITGGAASSKNITRPSGAATGDLLVANVVVFPASATLSAPSTGSWTTLIAKTSVGTEFAFAIFCRWDDGSSGPWAVDTTGATSWADGECVAYRGLLGSGTVLDGTPSVNLDTFGFSTSVVGSAVTTTRANDLILFYVLMGATRAQSGTPTGYTDRLVPGTAANYMGDKTQALIASTGDATLNLAAGTTNAAVLLPLFTQAASGSVPGYVSGVGITPTSAGVGTLLTVDNGVWTNSPTSFSYQWFRNTTPIGTNAATYTTVTADNGQSITCVVLASNASGSNSHTSNAVVPNAGTTPANSVLPTITGTPASGNVLTGHIGTWTGTPTTYSYEFRWLRAPTMSSPSNTGYQTIPGTAGTTSSAATTPTYTMGRNDASQSIVFHVTATNAAGSAAADSTSVIFYGTPIPFKSTGSPFLTTQASSSPVYNTALSSALQTAISNYRAAGVNWWNQGGNYADSYSVYFHRVDSTMPRTPFLVAGGGTYGGHDLRNPKTAQVKNGAIDTHLAWTVGVKNGGIPTPPGGFRVVGPNDAASFKDAHCLIFCEDTFELWELWETFYITPGGSVGGTPYSTDYDNQWICFWGGYMRDVRENDGRWFGNLGFGSSRYRLDRDGNFEYAGWGGTATSLCLGAITVLEKELVVDSEIGHGIGIIFPGHLSTFAYPASREASGEPGGTVGQGGWITLDPSFNIANLAVTNDLGTAGNAARARWLTAIQKYGATNMDSTGNIISVKQEAMGGIWPNIPNVDNQGGLSMNQIFDSVPSTAWKVLSPSWRPNGYVGNAKMSTIVDAWSSLNFAAWNTGGTVSAGSGHLTLTSTGSNVAIWPANWASQSLVGSTLHTQTITMPAGATVNSFGIQPLNSEYNSRGLRFNIIGGNLRCEEYGWYGESIGSDVVVAFNATNHKWIRLRMNSDHSVDWQTAPDNGSGAPGTWTTQKTSTPTIDLEDANIVYELTGPATTTAVWGVLNTTAVAGSPPVNTVAPALSPGSISSGGSLSTTNGTWSNSPTSFTYQWRRAGVNISGATSSTYVTVPADIGQAVTCAVTAINAFGSATAVSGSVTPTSGASAPVNTAAPVVTPGIAVPGTTLSTTNGTWNNTPTSFTYQWRSAGVNISGATTATYTATVSDVGQALTCVVTAINATGSASATSNAVTPSASTVTWVLGSG